MNKTSIEWTHRPETGGAAGGFTWNPIRARLKNWRNVAATDCYCPCEGCGNGAHCGVDVCDQPRNRAGTFCTRISPGCTHCYASTINRRFGNGLEFTVPNLEKVEFFIDEKILAEPLRRKKPATIFVGDMFDLFHEAIPQELIAMVFGVIASAGWHTFQVLTKRATRMQALIADVSEESFGCSVNEEWYVNRLNGVDGLWNWPLPNLWLGVSVESQQYADERIPLLLQTPAAVRFLSVEPMLGPVKLDTWLYDGYYELKHAPGIDWVICGGESGHGARPMHPDWARAIRDECVAAHRAFFFKQWGEWRPTEQPCIRGQHTSDGIFMLPNGQWGCQGDWWDGKAMAMERIGKNKAGAILDGREWREFPAERLVTA